MSNGWLWGAIVAVVLVVVVAYASSPLLSLSRLKTALEARNPGAVKQYVDFPRLKANVKRAEHQKIDRSEKGSFLAPVKEAVSKTIADIKLDDLASPQGLIHLVCDAKPDGDIDSSVPDNAPCTLKGHLAGFGYQSLDRFHAAVQPDHGKAFNMFFVRDHGLHWQLIDLK